MIDTEAVTLARYLDLLRSVPKAERLARVFALSALAREMTWQGATRHSGHRGPDAVVERFLLQLYGPDTAPRMLAALRAETCRMAASE